MQPHHTTPTKICTKCGESKPATTEYFNRHKNCKGGLATYCKNCLTQVAREYRIANRDTIAQKRRASYLAKSDEIKLRAKEYREANAERVREQDRRWRESNADHLRQRRKAYYAENRSLLIQYASEYREANRKRLADNARIYRKQNAKVIRARSKANALMTRAKNMQRRARKMKAEGKYTAKDIRLQYERQKGRCYWCGVKVGKKYHVDHVIPLSRGGTNWPENLVVACPTCNCSKGGKLPHEWPEGGRLL